MLELEARRALARAREMGAREWAPELLDQAELALRDGRAEERRQESLGPFRDFDQARSDYERAIRVAGSAVESAAATCSARIAAAETMVRQVVELTRGMHLGQTGPPFAASRLAEIERGADPSRLGTLSVGGRVVR